MSDFVGTKCDVCRKIKGDANKWIKYITSDEDDTFIWIGLTSDTVTKDACSDACIQKVLDRVLGAIRRGHLVVESKEYFIESKPNDKENPDIIEDGSSISIKHFSAPTEPR